MKSILPFRYMHIFKSVGEASLGIYKLSMQWLPKWGMKDNPLRSWEKILETLLLFIFLLSFENFLFVYVLLCW